MSKPIVSPVSTPRHHALAELLNGPAVVPIGVPRAVTRSLPCKSEGDVIRPCGSCFGTKGEGRHVRGCDIYGECTREQTTRKIQSCSRCNFYETDPTLLPKPPPPVPLERKYPPVGKRHLLYHLLPVKGTAVWRTGVDQLRLRWPLFTGRKVVSIATGHSVTERVDRSEKVGGRVRIMPIEPAPEVRKYLPTDCEVLEVPNDPGGWELASWSGLWNTLFDRSDPSDAVFYAHGKGVTRRPLSPCQTWAALLYQINLDHYSIVDRLLSSKKVVGGLVKHGHFGGVLSTSRWHYSGNFWWSRVGFVREALEATPPPADAWAPEAWTGMAFNPADCGDIFTPKGGVNHLYSPVELERLLVEYDKWLGDNPPEPVTAVHDS